jgi:hypothetical protein
VILEMERKRGTKMMPMTMTQAALAAAAAVTLPLLHRSILQVSPQPVNFLQHAIKL